MRSRPARPRPGSCAVRARIYRSYVTIKVVGADPLVHRFKFRLKNLSLTGPFDGPATVTLTYASTDRVGVISDCQVRASGLLCRQF